MERGLGLWLANSCPRTTPVGSVIDGREHGLGAQEPGWDQHMRGGGRGAWPGGVWELGPAPSSNKYKDQIEGKTKYNKEFKKFL
jgi:hypothetical protein